MMGPHASCMWRFFLNHRSPSPAPVLSLQWAHTPRTGRWAGDAHWVDSWKDSGWTGEVASSQQSLLLPLFNKGPTPVSPMSPYFISDPTLLNEQTLPSVPGRTQRVPMRPCEVIASWYSGRFVNWKRVGMEGRTGGDPKSHTPS